MYVLSRVERVPSVRARHIGVSLSTQFAGIAVKMAIPLRRGIMKKVLLSVG
jgi:hypothetical protein